MEPTLELDLTLMEDSPTDMQVRELVLAVRNQCPEAADLALYHWCQGELENDNEVAAADVVADLKAGIR